MDRLGRTLKLSGPEGRVPYFWCHACGRWVRFNELRETELYGLFRHSCGLALLDFETVGFDKEWLKRSVKRRRK